MGTIREYECPCCGGIVQFDIASQQMLCPFCDTTFTLETLDAYNATKQKNKDSNINWNTDSTQEWQEGEQEGMVVYKCESCGGEIIADATLGSTSCPYCDNNVVFTGQFTGTIRPDYVIPFKVDKNMAKAALNDHMKGKRLLPKVFKDKNHIDEIKGIYVPFWLFDADVDASVAYKATTVRTWSDSDNNYTETKYYQVSREGEIAFDKIPVDGSSKMPDDLMESIEPYNYQDNLEFAPSYLAGFLADKYDVDIDNSIDRANYRMKSSTESSFRKTVQGYSTVEVDNSSINISNGNVKYALLPVWILNTSWQNNKYTFAVNGQTGKIVGDLPVDKGAYWRWLSLLSVGFVAAFSAISYFAFW